uniref:Uncharacterized protein n=1 Tax=Serinus canaria TaxID=9135 RepID=A0A8C9N1K4_SERCA
MVNSLWVCQARLISGISITLEPSPPQEGIKGQPQAGGAQLHLQPLALIPLFLGSLLAAMSRQCTVRSQARRNFSTASACIPNASSSSLCLHPALQAGSCGATTGYGRFTGGFGSRSLYNLGECQRIGYGPGGSCMVGGGSSSFRSISTGSSTRRCY